MCLIGTAYIINFSVSSIHMLYLFLIIARLFLNFIDISM